MARGSKSEVATVEEGTVEENGSGRALDTIPPSIVKSSNWDEETLRGITDFDAAIALMQQTEGGVTVADQVLGDGFALLDSGRKGILEGVPLLFMEWTFNEGNFGTFVSARVVARNPDGGVSRYIINDGSTGIAEQLANYTKRTGLQSGLLVKNGLRVSQYEYEDPETGKLTPAETYYIDTSA